jgi:adenylate cyclase
MTLIFWIYEALIWGVLGHLIRTDRKPPQGIRYVNAMIETSIPSIMMLLLTGALEPVYTLTSIAPLVYFFFIILSVLRLEFWLCVFTGFVAASEYLLLSVYLLDSDAVDVHFMLGSRAFYWVKSVFFLIGGWTAGLITQQLRKGIIRSLNTMEERNKIERLFGQHASPEVVNELLKNPDTSSKRKHVCVMFVDIRGFTAFAEQQSPEETVSFLNVIFERMIDRISANHGIVHQLLGDGLMAIFGIPQSSGNEAINAVEAATQILEQVRQQIDDGDIPAIRLGIGIHSGEAIAGTIGSALHKEYKVTGDVVNLASRIEQLNKEFDSQLLVSAEVWNSLKDHSPTAVAHGKVQVRGRAEAIEIYQLAK